MLRFQCTEKRMHSGQISHTLTPPIHRNQSTESLAVEVMCNDDSKVASPAIKWSISVSCLEPSTTQSDFRLRTTLSELAASRGSFPAE
ncbi:hypothetical protein CDAR_546301 [Caerostris darwini]|uniref:Uncharacterized protein n=1 Tax=Caerostris darwini TaxID=1538125 RepID=A0AAV4RP24_9ARAC|nr:hypothetical protein CDAR_546301 [Caerostris darwini]